MPLPLILPIGVALLGGLAYKRAAARDAASATVHGDNDGFTPERKIVYETALKKMQDPAKLRQLAQAFRTAGLEPQAVMLEKRANLRQLPADVKAARAEVFRKAMKSTNVDAILKVADAYEQEGATGSAIKLRNYAEGLKS